MKNLNEIAAHSHELSYDKILKNTLQQSSELTILLINGLLGDNIPLDATVEWMDKETVNKAGEKYEGIVTDMYPRINGRLYAIEIEQDSKGYMAIRVFKYTVGGAILHGTKSSKSELTIDFPQPCVIFLTSTRSAPKTLTWNINFFDGQKVTLKVPTIRLAELSIREIADRNLLPIGQFYLRTFNKLTPKKEQKFEAAVTSLATEIHAAIENGTVPTPIGIQMLDTVKKTAENVINNAKETGFTMKTKIIETLPWVDYEKIFKELKAEGKAEGIAEGEAKGKAEGEAEGEAKGINTSAEIIRALKANEAVESIAARCKVSVDNVLQLQSALIA